MDENGPPMPLGNNSPEPPPVPPNIKKEVAHPRDLSGDEEDVGKKYGVVFSGGAEVLINLGFWDFKQFTIDNIRDMRPTTDENGVPAILFRHLSEQNSGNQWVTLLFLLIPPDPKQGVAGSEADLGGFIKLKDPEHIKVLILIILSRRTRCLNFGKIQVVENDYGGALYNEFPLYSPKTYRDWSGLRKRIASLKNEKEELEKKLQQKEVELAQSKKQSRPSQVDVIESSNRHSSGLSAAPDSSIQPEEQNGFTTRMFSIVGKYSWILFLIVLITVLWFVVQHFSLVK